MDETLTLKAGASDLARAAAVEVDGDLGGVIGLLAIGVAPGFEAFDDDPDFKDHGGEGENAQEIVGLGASEPSRFALEEIEAHGDSGENEHEDSGGDDEPDGRFFLA